MNDESTYEPPSLSRWESLPDESLRATELVSVGVAINLYEPPSLSRWESLPDESPTGMNPVARIIWESLPDESPTGMNPVARIITE